MYLAWNSARVSSPGLRIPAYSGFNRALFPYAVTLGKTICRSSQDPGEQHSWKKPLSICWWREEGNPLLAHRPSRESAIYHERCDSFDRKLTEPVFSVKLATREWRARFFDKFGCSCIPQVTSFLDKFSLVVATRPFANERGFLDKFPCLDVSYTRENTTN